VKSYFFDDIVTITIDDSLKNRTLLMTFDLKRNMLRSSYFESKASKCGVNEINKSSFTGNYLIRFSGCLNEGLITIWDVNTDDVLIEKVLQQTELLNYKAFDNFRNDTRYIESVERMKTKQLLVKLRDEKSAIYASEQNGKIKLMAGFYFENTGKGKGKGKNKNGGGKSNMSGGGNNKVNSSGGGGSGNGSGGGSGNGKGSKTKVEVKTKGELLFKSFEKYEKHRTKYMSFYFNLGTNQFENGKKEEKDSFKSVKEYKDKLTNIKSEVLFRKGSDLHYGYLIESRFYLAPIK